MTWMDETQASAHSRALSSAATLIVGPPGSGKTSILRQLASDISRQSTSCVIIAAGRHAADRLRTQLTEELGVLPAGLSVRTAQAWAFTILQAWAADRGRHTPELITGPGQDAILTDLLAEGVGAEAWPETITEEIRALPGFRAELRDLLTRAAELGLAPTDLEQIGREMDEPMWVAAASVMRAYDETLALEDATAPGGHGADRFDHARLVHQAATVLASPTSWSSPAAIPHTNWILVDDYENATLATSRLIKAGVEGGSRLCLMADPDVAVETFRGGIAHLPSRAATDFGAETIYLTRTYRGGTGLASVLARLTEHIGVAGFTGHRRPVPGEAVDSVEVVTFPGIHEERFHIARTLKLARIRPQSTETETPLTYDEMAVITRSRAEHPELERVLRGAGIEVRPAPRRVPLRFSPAVAGLMSALAEIIRPLNESEIRDLLASPIIGLGPVGLRRLSQQIAVWAGENGVSEPYRALVDHPIDEEWAEPLARLAKVCGAGRAAHEAGANAEMVLWKIWDAAGVAQSWRESAATDAGVSAMLDDVMATFRLAQRMVDRDGRVRCGELLDELAGQDVAEDTIARSGQQRGVHLLTPSMAVGMEFPLVIIASLQDGAWPNTRIRDGVFGSTRLADHFLGRLMETRRSVMADELRMFAMAVARSSRHLVMTAVASEEQSPSRFLDITGVTARHVDATPMSMSLPGIVGQLRSILTDPSLGGPEDVLSGAAAILAQLARDNVPGADPDTWDVLRVPSSDSPWTSAPRVSPSAISSILTCPLKWFIQRQNLTNVDDRYAAELGTFVHDLAERYSTPDLAAMLAELDENWDRLVANLPPGFDRDRRYERAVSIVETLANYLVTAGPGEKEKGVRATLGDISIQGRIDRVETDMIVDFKTGKSPLAIKDAQVDPQLRVYQWLWEQETSRPSMGAKLVYLGKPTKKGLPTERVQSGLTPQDREETEAAIAATAAELSTAVLKAIPNQECSTCPVRVMCPIRPEGAMSS